MTRFARFSVDQEHSSEGAKGDQLPTWWRLCEGSLECGERLVVPLQRVNTDWVRHVTTRLSRDKGCTRRASKLSSERGAERRLDDRMAPRGTG